MLKLPVIRVKALRQYERTTNEQFQAVGQSISYMESFEHVSKTEKKEEEKPPIPDGKKEKEASIK